MAVTPVRGDSRVGYAGRDRRGATETGESLSDALRAMFLSEIARSAAVLRTALPDDDGSKQNLLPRARPIGRDTGTS
jgi:hypothetical protein